MAKRSSILKQVIHKIYNEKLTNYSTIQTNFNMNYLENRKKGELAKVLVL